MAALLAALEASDIAQYLRFGRWSYAAVNAAHVLGLALLVGAILPLDLKLIGFWRSIAREALMRVLVPVAATGLLLAVASGFLLFATRAGQYAALPVFQMKLALVATGLLGAVAFHWHNRRGGRGLRPALYGFLSMGCWLGALVSGRLIAFMAD